MTSDRVVSDLMPPLWEELLWPFLDASDSVRLRTTATQWNVPGRYGPHGELFFFLLKKEPMLLREVVRLDGELLLLLVQKEPACEPDSEAFNSFVGDDFLILEKKCGSKDDQADNVSNEASYVIGLHGSGVSSKIMRITSRESRFRTLCCGLVSFHNTVFL